MNELSVTKLYQRRRRFSREFKAEIVAQCLEPGASVSRISLDNGLNANMVRRRMSEAQRADKTPGFVPVKLPAIPLQRETNQLQTSVAPSASRFPAPVARLWWSGLRSRRINVLPCCGTCWDDPNRRNLAGHRTTGYAGRARQGPGQGYSGLWFSQAALRLTEEQLSALVQGLPWQRLGADGVIAIL